MKKSIASLILISACITMSACGKEDVKKDENSEVECYVNVIESYLLDGKTDFSVSFIHLNDDDIKEMVIIFSDTQMDGGYVYTIKDGKAVPILAQDAEFFGQNGGFSYLESGNLFITENESVTDSQIAHTVTYYSMDNGEAICKDVTESVTIFDNDMTSYYINGKQVESIEFDDIEKKNGLLDMSTVTYQDGIRITDNSMEKVYKAY